ncbi:MAG: hypothetical protein IJA69_02495, partial [Clostridia bacterium]|nr:hypothetical protein [Clostridia bacterium]
IQTQNQNISCPNSVLKAYSGVTFGAASTFYVLNRKTQQPKGIFNKITLDSGKSYDLRIGSDIISSYLSDGNGNVDDNRVKDFVSVYEQVLGHFVSKSEKEMEFLSEIAYGSNKTSKQSNIIYMNPNDEARQALLSTIMASEDDPLFSFFDKMANPVLRRDYARDILSDYVITDDDFQDMTMKGTLRIFDMSKTSNGYDLSDMDKKIKLVEMLEKLENEYSVDNVAQDFLVAVKGTDGKVDFSFANNLSKLIQNSGVFLPEMLVSHRAEILRNFTNSDVENADKIAQGITKLSTIYEVDDASDAFELIFEEAFNPVTGKYDEQAFEELFSIVANVVNATDSIGTCDEDDVDELVEQQVDIVQGYFDEIRDENTGKIKKNHISPKEYLSKMDL